MDNLEIKIHKLTKQFLDVLIPNKVQENIKFKEQQCKYQYEENK